MANGHAKIRAQYACNNPVGWILSMTHTPSAARKDTSHRPLWQRVGTYWTAVFSSATLLWITGCATRTAPPEPAPAPVMQTPITPPPEPEKPKPVAPPSGPPSAATNILEFRKEVASHLYQNYGSRIYKGKLPPLLYAVGVLQVDIDKRGNVTGVRWMRAPSHAPEVMTEIEHMVRKSAPFPAPVRIGNITYTETWLWHKSGQFQLHTLSEGQY